MPLVFFYFLGFQELTAEIKADYSKKSIKNLCRIDGDAVELVGLKSAKSLLDIAVKFDIVHMKQSSSLFTIIWKEHLHSLNRVKLTIEDIKVKIWEPTFIKCNDLLNSVQDKSITLADVDRYMKPDENITTQLKRLYFGIGECLGNSEDNSSLQWIETSVRLMEEYWSLLELANAAKTVIKMKMTLKLTGDFSLIENIAKEVNIYM